MKIPRKYNKISTYLINEFPFVKNHPLYNEYDSTHQYLITPLVMECLYIQFVQGQSKNLEDFIKLVNEAYNDNETDNKVLELLNLEVLDFIYMHDDLFELVVRYLNGKALTELRVIIADSAKTLFAEMFYQKYGKS
jgi:hypothetical protein